MNKNNNHIDDEVLVKYLLGEASNEEEIKVRRWMNASPANKKYFHHFELIWQQSKQLEAKSNLDVNDAWERFKLKTEAARPTGRQIPLPAAAPRTNWMRAAAAIVMLAGLTGLLYYFIGGNNTEMIALRSEHSTLSQTLPDGSVVTLNKASVLTYPEEFIGNSRQVSLEGEAFFEVAPDKEKPFTITVNDAVVRVVGTSFNIKSSKEKTEVIVATGKVAVTRNEYEVKLSPNEKATILKSRKAPVKTLVKDELYNYYMTREFVCNGTPLWRLADVLNEAYGVNIQVAQRVRNLPLTTTFSNESLDSILAIISETFEIEVEKTGKNILLK